VYTHTCVCEWTPSYYTFVTYLCVVSSLFQDSQLATVSTLTPVSKIGPPSPFSARLLLTIITIPHYQVPIGLVFSIHDSTEVAIQKMIDASQRMLTVNSQVELGGLSPPQKRHLELEIETLENAPRDAEKLEKLLKAKQRQKEEAMHIEDTQRMVTEIEMLKVILYLVSRREEEQ
jgi:hypothetical protein